MAEFCTSYILVAGVPLVDYTVLGVFYLLALGYLFIGISIVSDVFMESIEKITEQTESRVFKIDDEEVQVEVTVWNPTVANLTLMALGSSAPEILLSVIETL